MNNKIQIHGRSPLAMLQQNKRDDARLFFRIKNHPIYFAPTRNSRPSFQVLLLVLCFAALKTTAQIKEPQTPGLPQFTPIVPGQSYSRPSYTYPAQPDNGNNAQTIINNTNRQGMNAMGYNPPVVPPSDPALRHQFILDQYNQSKTPSKQSEQLKQLNEILNADNTKAQKRNASAAPTNNKPSAEQQKNYTSAFNNIKNMLDGKTTLSVKEAYFQIESAFGNPYLSNKEYNDVVKKSVDFIKKWLTQNGYKLTDNNALNIGIQRFLSDTLTITVGIPDSKEGSKKVTHLPFFYDYNDFKGERDFRNYFSTKTLATGSGQCNSLPAVYLILAEGIGAKAYLTFAPMHSFVKYPDGSGYLKNYEPTSNWNITDKWYVENMFINRQAVDNRIYLDTLNKKQVVANCLIDLAHSYLYNNGASNDTFLRACVTTAMKSFPKGNNINTYFINSSYLGYLVKAEMQKAHITDIQQIPSSPKANALYQEYLKNEETISQFGYQDLPASVYDELMTEHEFKGRKQAAKNISGKEKRNQFVEIN